MDEPFSREKAAQYYVVAWVKNWSIRMYVNSVGLMHTNFSDVHDIYPWMAKDLIPYAKNMRIKPHTGYYMRPIQDKLFDANTNEQRLKIAKQIERWVSDTYGRRITETRDQKELYADKQLYSATLKVYRGSVDSMRKGSGHDWNTVK